MRRLQWELADGQLCAAEKRDMFPHPPFICLVLFEPRFPTLKSARRVSQVCQGLPGGEL